MFEQSRCKDVLRDRVCLCVSLIQTHMRCGLAKRLEKEKKSVCDGPSLHLKVIREDSQHAPRGSGSVAISRYLQETVGWCLTGKSQITNHKHVRVLLVCHKADVRLCAHQHL